MADRSYESVTTFTLLGRQGWQFVIALFSTSSRALRHAAGVGDPPMVQVLLEFGVDRNGQGLLGRAGTAGRIGATGSVGCCRVGGCSPGAR